MMKKNIRTGFVVIIAIVSLFLGFEGKQVSAQTQNNTVCVLGEPSTEKFPDVSLNFRVYDSNFMALKTLTQSNVSINENDNNYSPTNLNFDPQGTGLNIIFVLDRGHYTDVKTAKTMLLRFLDVAGVDGLDRISIILAGRYSTEVWLKPTTDFSVVKTKVNTLSETKLPNPTMNLQAIHAGLNLIRGDALGCSRPSAIFMLGGATAWVSENPTTAIMSDAVNTKTPVFFMHTISRSAASQEDYIKIAEASHGMYFPVNKELNSSSSDLDGTIFGRLSAMRGSYSVTYHSTSGESGKRDLAVILDKNAATSDSQLSTYAVNLQSPKVTLISPVEGSDFLRTATVFTDPKFLYDKDVVPIEFKIEWPDGFPRVPSKIRVIGTTSSGEQTIQEISETEYSRSNYTLAWNVDALTTEGSNPFGIRIEVIDELGLESITSPSNFTVTNLVPEAVANQTTEEIKQNLKLTQYFVYFLAGLIALLIALVIIFRKKIKQAFSSSGKIGMAIETVRKTIVGGTGRRKNPIARLEVVRPTVEVKSIFTESIKLGRDPNVSDYTFYSLNSDCSVSGEHAQLVKKRDGWKIIAVSHSGSPVFVDEQRIAMHQEVPIHTGQLIELGFQDLGSALFRFVEVASSEKFDFAVENDFKPDTAVNIDDGYRRTQVNMQAGDDFAYSNPQNKGEQAYTNQDFFASTSTDDDDFDSLFNNLREGS